MQQWLRQEKDQWRSCAETFRACAPLLLKTALLGMFLCHALFVAYGYTSPDGTNEGLIYEGKKIFTVQFHPEACPGPQDSGYLFDRFMDMMKGA